MKAGADFEQAADAAAQLDTPAGRLGDAAEDFQQRRFAGAVAADDADDLAGLYFEITSRSAQKFAASSARPAGRRRNGDMTAFEIDSRSVR